MKIKRENLADVVPASVDDAFSILDTFKRGIPYEAIRYLREQKPSKKITAKIVHALENTYTDFYYDETEDTTLSAPLWYATVAETHLSKELINPVMQLFSTNDDWDAMDEQGEFLIGVLSDKYPHIVASKVMDFIDTMIVKNPSAPCLYLFDALYKADVPKYKQWFLNILENRQFEWAELFASVVADLGIKEAVPIIEKRIAEMDKNYFGRGEYEYALEKLANGAPPYTPYYLTRGDWEEQLIVFEDIFFDDKDSEDDSDFVKVGRNDPCPCGKLKPDGKPLKYKKCCGR